MRYNQAPLPKYVFDPRDVESAVAARPAAQYEFGQTCVIDRVQFEAGAASLANPDHPDRNEDDLLVARSKGIRGLPTYAVFDGVSNPPGSERAAFIAREVLRQEYANVGVVMESDEAESRMNRALYFANEAIWAYGHTMRMKLGTAVVALRPFRDPNGAWLSVVGHSGDCRAVRFTPDGTAMRQMTIDHTIIPDWNEDKQYRFAQAHDVNDLDPGEETEFRQRYGIYAALGSQALRCNVETHPLLLNELTVLSSDGIHDALTYGRMADIIGRGHDMYETAYVMAAQSQRVWGEERNHGGVFRGKHDDATALILRALRAQPLY